MGAGYRMGHIKRVLIVAPTSVVAVWPQELENYAAFPFTVRALLGTRDKRLKELNDLERFPYEHLKAAVILSAGAGRAEMRYCSLYHNFC